MLFPTLTISSHNNRYLCTLRSVREGVPGAEALRGGSRAAVRDEGAEEGDDRAEAEDDGAHQGTVHRWCHLMLFISILIYSPDGALRPPDHPPVALPRHHALRLPDTR